MKPLYDNEEGYSPTALYIMDKVLRFTRELIEEYDEYSALELASLAHGSVQEAFCSVSIERRLGWPKPE